MITKDVRIVLWLQLDPFGGNWTLTLRGVEKENACQHIEMALPGPSNISFIFKWSVLLTLQIPIREPWL